jgi:hypothetical protein
VPVQGRLTPEYDPDPTPAPAWHAPLANAPPYRPPAPAPAFHGGIPQSPFHEALHEAHQRVVQAQHALPKQPTPYIPRVPNPTPAQARAALTIARNSQRQALGPNASVQRIQQYQQELGQDPRQQEFLQTVEHMARALALHEGPRRDLAEAKPAPAPSGLGSLPIIGAARNYLSERGAEDIPAYVSVARALNPLEGPIQHKIGDTAQALYQDPIGTLRATATSVPPTLNALLTGTARLGWEATAEGKPGTAADQLVKSIERDATTRYGSSSAADIARMKKEGILPEILDASLLVGGPASAAGRVASRVVEKTGFGAADFARAAALREATTHALQTQDVAKLIETGRNLDPAGNPVPSLAPLTRAQGIRAALHESAAQPRPNLRTAPGNEEPSVVQGAAVRPQGRSSNLFRALGQTGLDNARRSHLQGSLRDVAQAQQDMHLNPHVPGAAFPVPYASQLALDTRRAEVAPLIQRGANAGHVPGAAFVGAARQQRIGTSYLKGDSVAARRAEGDPLQQSFNALLKQATPEQRKVLFFAKQGQLPLHDPQAATDWLKEIHDQAVAGSTLSSGKSIIPAADQRAGSSVARETGSVLKHIEKHGAGSVFTPEFKKLVETIPDERLTAPRDPGLSADSLVARRYLPQMHTLEAWAQRHPGDPAAEQTRAGVEQIRTLLQEGNELRSAAFKNGPRTAALHEYATQKFVTAKNLADEVARMHGLPTDRAYLEHTKTFELGARVHTIGTRTPGDFKQWHGELQKMGYHSTDANLILNGMLKNIRNDHNMRFVKAWHSRYNVAPSGLTGPEVQRWLKDTGHNPRDWTVLHPGKLRESIADQMNAEHMPHLGLDVHAHAQSMANLVDQAMHVAPADTTKGAGAYPTAAVNELRGVFAKPGLPGRLLGRAKAMLSKEMLGLSLPWMTTMSTVTYPAQSLFGGAGAIALREAHAWYHGMSAADKAHVDAAFGVDSRFQPATHGITSERLGATAPKAFEGFARTMQVAKANPFVKQLARMRPDEMILRIERTPRRYARINVAYKGVKTQALREILREAKGAAAAQSKFQLATQRLLHFGRRPAQDYLDAAMKNQRFVEENARRLNNLLGEWKNTTQFERNVLNRMVLFYPWVRYSVKLATQTLPRDHPLAYGLALKYGTIQHEYLRELLGTDPTPGNVYLGPEQPQTKPENRKWSTVGIRQANPLLNTVMDLVSGTPSQAVGALPPYMSSLVEWAVNRNLFTDKALKGGEKGEPEVKSGRPQLLPFLLNQDVVQPISPLREANKIATEGRPQAADSLFGSRPVQYGSKTMAKIDQEAAARSKEGVLGQVLGGLLPLAPHSDQGKLAAKIRAETRAGSEQRSKERKEGKATGTVSSDPIVRLQVKEAVEAAKRQQQDPIVRQQIKEAVEAAKAGR